MINIIKKQRNYKMKLTQSKINFNKIKKKIKNENRAYSRN